MKLRLYESEWISRIKASTNRRVLLVGPTGCGKTVVAVGLIRGAIRKDKKVLFLAHRVELITQAKQRLVSHGVKKSDAGTILSGEPENRAAKIQVASVQTLARREKPHADIVFIDEAHHAAAATYRKILDAYPGAMVYGLTATPYRLDGKPLGDLFDEIIESDKPSKLIDGGWIQRPRVWTVPIEERANISKVKTTAGDFNVGQLDTESNKKKLVGSIVDHWKRLADGRPTVCYAVSIRHARRISREFNVAGVKSKVLSGETPTIERAELLRMLRDGEISVLVNCMVLTEGWDCTEVRCAIVARPTMSQSLWFQMCGRIMRPGELQPIVLDHAGNALWMPLPGDDIEHSLDSEQRKTGPVREAKEKTCKECGNRLFLGCRVCPNCGHEFWTGDPPEEIAGELRESVRDDKEICRLYTEERLTITQIASRLGRSKTPVYNALNRNGVGLRDRSSEYLWASLDHKAVIKDYLSGEIPESIGKKYNVSRVTIATVLKKNGVSIRGPRSALLGFSLNEKDVINRYANGESTEFIAKTLGCSGSAIAKCVKRNGLIIRTHGEAQLGRKIDIDSIIQQYSETGSGKAVAQKNNISRTYVYRILKKYNVTVKKRPAANQYLIVSDY